jgi:PAS domain S-box-containing protein
MKIRSLHSKLLGLIIVMVAAGIAVTGVWVYSREERQLLDEKLKATELMAGPLLHSIYKDMLAERADLVRHMIGAMKQNADIARVQIIRSNGMEEAFKDYKTIDAVEVEFGEIKPEWVEEHQNVVVNIADGVDSDEFRKAFAEFKRDWTTAPKHYIEKDRDLLTYLHPIEMKPKCNGCHETEGARGILMISTSLDEMYAGLRREKYHLMLAGLFAIALSGMLLSAIIKSLITGPIAKTAGVIKRVTGGEAGMSERVSVTTSDEIGYLGDAFNGMLETLQKRDDANRRLFSTVIKSREEWVTTFDSIQDMLCIVDRKHSIIKVNMALARKFDTKPEALIGRKYYDLLYGLDGPHSRCPHLQTMETKKTASAEFARGETALDGFYEITTFPIIGSDGDAASSVLIIRDVTAEKTLKEQLFHSEKMSSIGKFVAGIAHELNNPLMGIMGFSQILIDSQPDKKISDADVKDKLDKIYKESLRTAKIVQNLLTFARVKKSEKALHNLNNIIRDTVELRAHALKDRNIEVKTLLADDLPETMVDYYQMQQVFINVINNAVDAMTHAHGKGVLEITSAVGKSGIIITFIDDGPGIPPDVMGKIFDPFFTTKEVGKGTGLGLSITHGIIVEHSGTIDYNCPPDGGTVVVIKLPILRQKTIDAIIKDEAPPAVKPSDFSGKRVLIADDEQSIREALSQVLSSVGFGVDSAMNGREALDVMARKKIDVVIADIKMPEMNGMELYDSIAEGYPALASKVIFLTGDVLSDDVKGFLDRSGRVFLLKPFDPSELLAIIRNTLKG